MRALLLILALAALLLPEPAPAQIRLPSIKNKLIELALDQISSPGSFEVTAGSIEDLEDGITSLADVQVSDGEGVWLSLERLNFSWRPDRLLSGELAITRLELIGLTVSRPPSEKAKPPELRPREPSGRGLFDWPRAPIALTIEGVRLERARIAEGVLPQPIAFDAEGRALDKGDAQELALSLTRTDAVAGKIDLAMQRDFAANTVKLTLTAEEAPGGMVAAAAGFPADAPAQLLLTADGPPEDWRLNFDAAVERVFAATGHAALAYADRLSLDADFTVTPGPDLGEEARTILGEQARLTARLAEREDGRIEVLAGELTSPALSAQASGALATGAGDSDLTVSLIALKPLAALAEAVEFDRFTFDGKVTGPRGALTARGRMALSGLATAPLDAGELALEGGGVQSPAGLTFALEGKGQGLRLDRLGPELIGPARLGASGTLEGGLLTLGQAALDSRALTATASGSYDLAAAKGDLDIGLAAPEIAPLAAAYGATAEGSVTASAEAVIAGDRIDADLSATLSRFAMDPVSADRLTVTGRIASEPAQLSFDLTGGGQAVEIAGVPAGLTKDLHFTAKGHMPAGNQGGEAQGALSLAFAEGRAESRFHLAGPALTLEDLEAQFTGVDLSGKAVIDLDTSLIEGALNLTSADLAPLSHYAGLGLGGLAQGQISLTPADSRQGLSAELELTDVTAGGATAARVDLRITAADAFGEPHFDARLEAKGVEAAEIELTTLRVGAAGPLRALALSAAAEGSLGGDPLAAMLEGKANLGGTAAAVTLARAEVKAGKDSVRLLRPLDLRVSGGRIAATGLDLALPGEAALTGDAAFHPGGLAGGLSGDLTLARLPLAVLQRRTGAPFSGGLLDARATFDTRHGRAGAELSARARGLQFSRAELDAGALDLDLDARWDGARLDAKAELRGDFGDPLRSRLAVPLRPGPGGIPEVPADGALEGAFVWAGEIGDLWALVPAPGHILTGRADLDLRLGGTRAAPRLSGRADVTGGEYQNLITGTILTGLTIGTTIAEGGTVNVTLDALDGAKGEVRADAALTLGAAEPAIDATARINKATLVRRDDVTGKFSGEVALSGPFSDLLLKGRIAVDKAELRLIDATPPELVDLEGIRIKGALEPEGPIQGESRLRLDLSIAAKKNIFVRGRGLDSEWKMDLAITGNAAVPVITGAAEKLRGRLDLLGRPFDLTRGRVVFDGGREVDPLLDIAVELEENDIRGGITLDGRASAPELHFISTPPLPEDEVLPRLFFGRSRQLLSAPEALQLISGVATLMSGRAGPLDRIRSAAGIDVLRVDGESVETTTVTVGRNVARGVFVGARQGLGEQGSTVAVEIEVFDGVVLDTELGQESGADIGITLRKDF